MTYTGRPTTSAALDTLDLCRREMAKRGIARSTSSRQKGKRESLRSVSDRNTRVALTWLTTAFRVHDPVGVQHVLGAALVRRYKLEWDPRRERGKRLRALWWRKRTPLATAFAEELVRQGDQPTIEKALHFVCGSSLSEELERAARDFQLSPTTLRRLVRGEAKSLSWIFAERLRKRLKRGEWEKLEAALLSPAARKTRDGYAGYIERQIHRLTIGRSGDDAIILTKEERVVRDSFERTAMLLGAPAPRAQLSALRVYDAFVGWGPLRETLGTYPTATARLPLVKQGFRRELTLLRIEMQLFRKAARLPRV